MNEKFEFCESASENATKPTIDQIRVPGVPESIACTYCDCDSPESLEEAAKAGWSELIRDDGIGWNYLGICPECQADEARLLAEHSDYYR